MTTTIDTTASPATAPARPRRTARYFLLHLAAVAVLAAVVPDLLSILNARSGGQAPATDVWSALLPLGAYVTVAATAVLWRRGRHRLAPALLPAVGAVAGLLTWRLAVLFGWLDWPVPLLPAAAATIAVAGLARIASRHYTT